MDHFLSVDELHKAEFYFWTSDQALPNLDRPKLQLQLLGLLICKRTCRVLNEWKTGYDMRSQSWILHFLGYLCKFHRTLSRMQKASQSVGKTSKPDGWVIFTPQKWIENQIYNPWTRSWDRSKTLFTTRQRNKRTHGHTRAGPIPRLKFMMLNAQSRHQGSLLSSVADKKGSRPLGKRSVLNAKFLWISALLLREVGYIKVHKYGNWITALKTSVHHFRFWKLSIRGWFYFHLAGTLL